MVDNVIESSLISKIMHIFIRDETCEMTMNDKKASQENLAVVC